VFGQRVFGRMRTRSLYGLSGPRYDAAELENATHEAVEGTLCYIQQCNDSNRKPHFCDMFAGDARGHLLLQSEDQCRTCVPTM
jgi:hypothetical protein